MINQKTGNMLLYIFILLVCSALTFNSALAQDEGYVSIHGFVSQGALISNDNNYLTDTEDLSFDFHEIGLNFSTDLTDVLRTGLQIFSRDLGPVGNNDLDIDWAFVEYFANEYFGLRFGKTRMPAGIYNQVRDVDLLRSCIILPQGVYNEYWRDILAGSYGINVFGVFTFGDMAELSYDISYGQVEVDDSDTNPWIQETMGAIANVFNAYRLGGSGTSAVHIDAENMLAAQIAFSFPDIGLKFAANLLQLDLEARFVWADGRTIIMDSEMNESYVYSVEWVLDRFTFAAEYMQKNFDNDLAFIGAGTVGSKSDTYYGMITFRLNESIELGTYFSRYWDDTEDRDGDTRYLVGQQDYKAWQDDLALFARIDLSEYWIVKLEYHDMNGAALVYNSMNPEGIEEDWNLFVAKTTINF